MVNRMNEMDKTKYMKSNNEGNMTYPEYGTREQTKGKNEKSPYKKFNHQDL